MFVTDGNRESTIVGSYHGDGFSNITRYVQLFVLTSIGCLVLGSIWGLACKKKRVTVVGLKLLLLVGHDDPSNKSLRNYLLEITLGTFKI